jgi:hypothetical protein
VAKPSRSIVLLKPEAAPRHSRPSLLVELPTGGGSIEMRGVLASAKFGIAATRLLVFFFLGLPGR